eukprot:m51a1_g3785 hypothetical protein (368) ;mRNA; r:171983-173339
MDRSSSDMDLSKHWSRGMSPTDSDGSDDLRSNEALALSVERMWFSENELEPRVEAVRRALDECTRNLAPCGNQTPMSFELSGGGFRGFVVLDGHKVGSGVVSVTRPEKAGVMPASTPPPSSPVMSGPTGVPSPQTPGAIAALGAQGQSSTASRWPYSGKLGKNPWCLQQIQDAYNFARLAAAQFAAALAPSGSSVSAAPQAASSVRGGAVEVSALAGVDAAMEMALRAWDLLTHAPADSFPQRVAQPPIGVLEPMPPEDLVVEMAVSVGELVLRAHVLHVDWPAKAREGRPLVTGRTGLGRIDNTTNAQIGQLWCKVHTYSESATLAVLASHEVHFTPQRLAAAYRCLSCALSDAAALRDLLHALSY